MPHLIAEAPRGARPSRGLRTPRRAGLALAVAVALTTGVSAQSALAAPSPAPSATTPDFGPNVTIFDPSMPIADIQAKVDAVAAAQVDNEMGTRRDALLFKPGTYGTTEHPLQMKVGYYTEVAGLGASPTDVTVNGKIEVYNRCLEGGGTSNCIALDNFWRTLSNLTLNVNGAGQDGCRQSANFWAVSQAVSLRRLNVTGGNLSFMDYCTAGPQYASGGYLADSKAGTIVSGSQQQWFTRNSTIGSWSNGVWNQVFAGVLGAPTDELFPNPPYTTLPTTPLSREKPYIFIDAKGKYNVRVPSAQHNSTGVTWDAGMTPGRTLPITDFFLAKPSDSVQTIKKALDKGKNLLLTPGVYDIDKSIEVTRPDTVVLGIGHATLTAVNGAIPMTVSDVKGVIIAGVSFDAGTKNSPALLKVGNHGDHSSDTRAGHHSDHKSDANDPTTLSDVYFRVGGPHVGKADVSLLVNADNVLIDHTWVWRADHGVAGSVGWTINTGRNGVVVNGDDVTATGLFVEHFQQYNVIWNGERGKTIFFQNELPYDAPNQAAWQHDGLLGWAAYKVADSVKTNELWGGGSYIYTNVDPTIHASHGFEVPVTPGVKLHHILTVNLGAGTLDHVVNGIGGQVDNSNTGTPAYVPEFP